MKTIPLFTAAIAATLVVLPARAQTSGPAVAPTLPPMNVSNISVRTVVGPGNPSTVGFVIAGATPHRVLVRSVGPGLAAFGITNPLSNPKLTLYSGSQVIATNRAWGSSVALDTAVSPSTGTTTTAGTVGPPGVGPSPTVASVPGGALNPSVTPDAASPAAGPAALPTVTTTLPPGGTLVNGASFSTAPATAQLFMQVGAFGLQDGSKDAAVVATLPPGAYTVVVQSDPAITPTGAVVGGAGIASVPTGFAGAASTSTAGSTGPASGVGTTGGGTAAGIAGGSGTTVTTTGDVLVEVYFVD